jgi:hypothetical protein
MVNLSEDDDTSTSMKEKCGARALTYDLASDMGWPYVHRRALGESMLAVGKATFTHLLPTDVRDTVA